MKKQPPTPKKPRGAPKGSANAEALKTPAERQEAYRLYCLHIGAGYMGNSFYEPVVEDTMQDYMKKYPAEFDLRLLAKARAKGRLVWEQVGFNGTVGKIKGFNAHSWGLNVKNRLGWKDRAEVGLDGPTRAVFKLKLGRQDLGDEKED
jgi:hypothetical protein